MIALSLTFCRVWSKRADPLPSAAGRPLAILGWTKVHQAAQGAHRCEFRKRCPGTRFKARECRDIRVRRTPKLVVQRSELPSARRRAPGKQRVASTEQPSAPKGRGRMLAAEDDAVSRGCLSACSRRRGSHSSGLGEERSSAGIAQGSAATLDRWIPALRSGQQFMPELERLFSTLTSCSSSVGGDCELLDNWPPPSPAGSPRLDRDARTGARQWRYRDALPGGPRRQWCSGLPRASAVQRPAADLEAMGRRRNLEGASAALDHARRWTSEAQRFSRHGLRGEHDAKDTVREFQLALTTFLRGSALRRADHLPETSRPSLRGEPATPCIADDRRFLCGRPLRSLL